MLFRSRVEALVSASPEDEDGKTREEVVKTEIDDVYKRQVYENLEALYICRNVITVYPDCKSMIDVARQKMCIRDSLYPYHSDQQGRRKDYPCRKRGYDC